MKKTQEVNNQLVSQSQNKIGKLNQIHKGDNIVHNTQPKLKPLITWNWNQSSKSFQFLVLTYFWLVGHCLWGGTQSIFQIFIHYLTIFRTINPTESIFFFNFFVFVFLWKWVQLKRILKIKSEPACKESEPSGLSVTVARLKTLSVISCWG